MIRLLPCRHPQSREEYLRLKADKEAAAKAQVEAEKAYAEQLAEAEAEAHARKMAAIRARAADTQGFVKTQMHVSGRVAARRGELCTRRPGCAESVALFKAWRLLLIALLPRALQSKERAAVDDDTSMSARERELNGRLLRQAHRIVGEPKQFSVKLY